MNDDDGVAELLHRAFRAWDDGDAAAYGACFTGDCDYVAFDGYRAHGRDAVIDSHDKLFRGVLFGSRLVGEIETIRYLDDDIALIHATGSVLVAWRNRLPRRRLTRLSMVAVRGPDGWRFTSTHNSRVRPVGVPEPDSMPARAARALVRGSRAAGMGRHQPVS